MASTTIHLPPSIELNSLVASSLLRAVHLKGLSLRDPEFWQAAVITWLGSHRPPAIPQNRLTKKKQAEIAKAIRKRKSEERKTQQRQFLEERARYIEERKAENKLKRMEKARAYQKELYRKNKAAKEEWL